MRAGARRAAASALAASLAILGCRDGHAHDATVLAAASLGGAFGELAALYERDHPGARVALELAASSTLAAQVRAGARFDILATADERTVATRLDRLEARLPDATPGGDEALRRRIRRLRGVLTWSLETQYHSRLTDAFVHLRELDQVTVTIKHDAAGGRAIEVLAARPAGDRGVVSKVAVDIGELKVTLNDSGAELAVHVGPQCPIELNGEAMARTGAMVAYQGQVQFQALGSGGAAKWLKQKLTGEGVPLMKRVLAVAGQTVCRTGLIISVDGIEVGAALERDRSGRDLPVWQGCRIISDGELFLMNWDIRDSLDGRYFGPVPASSVIGRALPLWTDEEGDGRYEWRAVTH